MQQPTTIDLLQSVFFELNITTNDEYITFTDTFDQIPDSALYLSFGGEPKLFINRCYEEILVGSELHSKNNPNLAP